MGTGNNEVIIQIELAEKILADPMTVSNILRTMEKKRFIERVRGLVNTKIKEIHLKKQSEDLYHRAKFEVYEMRKKYHSVDIKQLINQLQKLSN